jgi:hypothetical protein
VGSALHTQAAVLLWWASPPMKGRVGLATWESPPSLSGLLGHSEVTGRMVGLQHCPCRAGCQGPWLCQLLAGLPLLMLSVCSAWGLVTESCLFPSHPGKTRQALDSVQILGTPLAMVPSIPTLFLTPRLEACPGNGQKRLPPSKAHCPVQAWTEARPDGHHGH